MIRNFRPIEGKEGFAVVETSIFGMFKKDRIVYKEKYGVFWRWFDTGNLISGFVVENLSSAHMAAKRLGE